MSSQEMKDSPWHKIYNERGIPGTLKPYPEVPTHFFLDRAAERDNSGGCVQLGLMFSYPELKDHADRLAGALASRGVQKGHRVATMLPASIQFVICDAAISKAGAAHVPCNILEPPDMLANKIAETSPEVLICLEEDMDKARHIQRETSVKHVIVSRLYDYSSNPREIKDYSDAESFLKVVNQSGPSAPSVSFNTVEDLESLFFTGGTTGTAKCCMLSHYNVVANVQQNLGGFGLHSYELSTALPVLVALPMYHVYGHATMHSMISLGAKIIIINDPRDVEEMKSLASEHNPLLFFGVPAHYIKLLQENVTGFLPLGISGSAPLPPNVSEKMEESAGMHITEGYGLSEMTMSTHYNVTTTVRKRGSIGIPLPDTEVKIIDVDTGKVLEIEEMIKKGLTGEMLLKGPQRMVGYWPEAGSGTDEEGFIHTGDVVRIDEDGYFYIVDRLKDMINVSGLKVYSREIENVLYKHPVTDMAAVVGIPDPEREGSERIIAFVQPKPEKRADASEEDYLNFLREKVAKYALPKSVIFLDEMPVTGIQKINKKLLRDRYS